MSQASNIVAALVALGFAGSNKEAKRKLEEGAIRVNDAVVSDGGYAPQAGDKISFGKKKHGMVAK